MRIKLFLFLFTLTVFAWVSCDDDDNNNNETGCEPDHIEEEGICINSKQVPCIENTPENATTILGNVQINYTDASGWTQAIDCEWDCNLGYVEDGTGCIEENSTEPVGVIAGECGVVTLAEIESASPFIHDNTIDFGETPYDASDCSPISDASPIDATECSLLTEGGQIIINTDNAGGSSVNSEVFAFEVLNRCEGASLLKTETEIIYDSIGKITDILVEIQGRKIGVSVTRAFGYPPDFTFTTDDASYLLNKKLSDIIESTQLVSTEDRWDKQILFIMTDTATQVTVLQQTLDTLVTPAIKSDTIVYITQSDGVDNFIYEN
jgi:hypothetical protein